MNHFRTATRTGAVVLSVAWLAIVAGCGGGGTAAPPSGNPDPNPPAPTLSRLTLTGTVTDAPIANAVVTATVGGQTFTANADANGNYSLEIALAQNATGGFVTLRAKGVGAQSYVEFISLVGTFSSLLTQAGSDATLSSSENFATQITNVSTALAVLLEEANGGQPVSSETSMQTLSASLNSQDVLNLATAIKLLVDEPEDYPMPNGQASLSVLLSNRSARQQIVDAAYSQDRAIFAATQTAIVSDATLVKPITPATVPSNLLATSLPDNLNDTYFGVDRAVAYSFNADGTGTASTSSWHRNMTWHITGSSIEIAYEGDPIEMWGIDRAVCPDDGFGYAIQDWSLGYYLTGATLRQLSDRILAVTENREIFYRVCGSSGPNESVTVARTLVDSQNSQTIEGAELRDTTRTLWIYDAFSDVDEDTLTVKVMPDIADLHADGTGTTRVFNKQFSWALDVNGKVLTARFDDGTVAKYRSLREVDDVTTDVLYDLALPTGKRTVGSGVSIKADPQPFSFTRNNVVGRLYSLGVGEEIDPTSQRKGYRFRLDADGMGSREDEFIDESGNIIVLDVSQSRNYGLFWSIDQHDLLVWRTRSNENPEQGIYDCLPEMDPFCVKYDERRFIPLASNGARTYSLAYRRNDNRGVSDSSARNTYVIMYDYEPFAGSGLSSKRAVVSKRISRSRRAEQGWAAAPAGIHTTEGARD